MSVGWTVFWSSIALIGWNLIGYPLLVLLLAATRRPFVNRRDRNVRQVTVIVAAHDEEKVIGERVRNLREQVTPYPVQILVVADGCEDDTVAIARAAGASVIEQPRGGKVAALREAVRHAAGDVLVLTDANTRFAPGALAALVRPLADARVGIAAGDLRYENAGDSISSSGENAYWTYETRIKRAASRAGLLLMGAGGIYAVRREDWPLDLPPDLADDSFVPLSLHRQGRINLFVPEAVAYERAGATMREEWRRRVRMVAQDTRVALRLGFGLPRLATCFALASQKLLRWLLLPLALGALVVLLESTWTETTDHLWLLLGVYLLAGAFLLSVLPPTRGALLSFLYLVGATAAAFLGFLAGLSGRSPATWRKAESTRA